jgi:hypothetical protein
MRETAMTKPEIIGSARSSYTRVVRMVCEEKGIDHVLTETMLGAPEICAIHPFGKMPVLATAILPCANPRPSRPISIAVLRARNSFRPIRDKRHSPSNGCRSSTR